MNAISQFLGVGVYEVTQAARLAEVPPRQARAWVKGYARPANDAGKPDRKPLLGSRLSSATADPLVTFADLIEMRFCGHFRKAGFSWPRILKHLPEFRRVLRQEQRTGRLTFESDGVTILAQAVAADGVKKGLELASRQHVMVDLLQRTFREELSFSADGFIEAWRPRAQYRHVLIDPNRQFGEPIVEPGVPAAILAEDLIRLGGDAAKVARRYNVEPDAVIEAHRFQTDLRPAA
ncbi:hypothetical protein HB662_19765 [Roseomonas frigidaquae]|uniref:Putative antitoxin VapB45-like DNA-binding HTH domain-containing protein n=1 Tax=Falsiroseomonas frigidaquae TaxID=487318 RepID=A0ABX1F3T6_9PROT|nr:hypothetical protein [Falsiroseomonas frigidaquae]NKE47027.1 hypothetical protein [Falsiroseomonas frigidaquae]